MFGYRVVKTKDGQYGVAEVYMDDKGVPYKRSQFINGIYDSYIGAVQEFNLIVTSLESNEPIEDLPYNKINE